MPKAKTLPEIDFSAYEKITLIAWSMGVYMSSQLELPLTRKIAFCGTGSPIDEKNGIHPKVYQLTIQSCSRNLLPFNAVIFQRKNLLTVLLLPIKTKFFRGRRRKTIGTRTQKKLFTLRQSIIPFTFSHRGKKSSIKLKISHASTQSR